MRNFCRVFSIGAIASFIFASSPLFLQAQSCIMCQTTARALPQVWALNVGILFLLVPPLGIMSTFLYLAFKDRS